MYGMFHPKEQKEKSEQEPKGDEDLQFCWGLEKETIKVYESFSFDGIEYFLYDCVYMWRTGQADPDIGKLVRILELESREKKVEIVWFFRPSEIAGWLKGIKPRQRELFLACGCGKGLSNLNPLEAISGKCNVVCLSKHKSNTQPTEEELRKADYIFYRTFDVGSCIISEKFPNSIGGIKVDHFFNRRICANPRVSEPKAYPKARSDKASVSATQNDHCTEVEKGSNIPVTSTGRLTNGSMKDGPRAEGKLKRSIEVLSASPYDTSSSNKRKLLGSSAEGRRNDAFLRAPPRVSGQEKRIVPKESFREKRDLSTQKSLDEKPSKFNEKGPVNKQPASRGIRFKYIEVERRPHIDSSKWLKLDVWSEEGINKANEKGTLVVLENLDPSFTSEEVEDIIWNVFVENVKAKMVQRTAFSSPHSGQALIIFKTKEAADKVISNLANGCLVLGDLRPIVGRRRLLKLPADRFCGHLSIDRPRHQRQRQEIKNAVATSHFSQGNTIEFELAMEWRLLQEKTDLWWRALYEEQGDEIEALMKQMKGPTQK